MKSVYRKSIIFIAIFVIFLAVTQWILWSHTLGNYIPPHDYPTYDSLEQYTKENTNSECLYSIIAQDDEIAVCYADSIKSIELKILSKTETGKWIVLSRDLDYKTNFYTNKSNNPNFNNIFIYSISNSSKKIIIVEKYIKSGNYVFDEEREKLKSICDSQNTVFSYKASQSNLYADYIGFVDNFDEDTYTLIVNDKEYPYKEWKKLLKR